VPDIDWNRARWNDEHLWPESGDEWSERWGGPKAQWYGAIFPRIARWLPAARVLEIAPGHGRWTQFLLRQADAYYGVDLSPRAVERCRQRFAAWPRAHFLQNDGRSLDAIPDASIDFAFSYDSMVHLEIDVMAAYCDQIVRKLAADGVAFIHHSNAAGGVDADQPDADGRGRTVSSEGVRQAIQASGGRILIQEQVNWGGVARIDCMTTFCHAGAYAHVGALQIRNDSFMIEAALIRQAQSPYHR
jgi:SAM-dependent methyltransferase